LRGSDLVLDACGQIEIVDVSICATRVGVDDERSGDGGIVLVGAVVGDLPFFADETGRGARGMWQDQRRGQEEQLELLVHGTRSLRVSPRNRDAQKKTTTHFR